MKKKHWTIKIFIALCCVFNVFTVQSQMISIDGNKYIYEGQQFDKSNINGVLQTSETALSIFNSSQKSKKNADILGYSSIGALAVSGWFYHRSTIDTGDTFSGLAESIYSAGFAAIGAILGTTGIIYKVQQNNRVTSAVNLFNEEVYNTLNKDGAVLDIEVGATSFGLTYNF